MAHDQYLTRREAAQINERFNSSIFQPNRQVLWHGLRKEEVQLWADKHDMQTLTAAMGPLMDRSHPLCLKPSKSDKAWSKYVKGASILFARKIAQNHSVIVLSPHPPQRLHPSGLTTYQCLEEPILKGRCGYHPILQINIVHPTVQEAEDFVYQLWPIDECEAWLARFGKLKISAPLWRPVRGYKPTSVQRAETTAQTAITGTKIPAEKKQKGKKIDTAKVVQRKTAEKVATGNKTGKSKVGETNAADEKLAKTRTSKKETVEEPTAGKKKKKTAETKASSSVQIQESQLGRRSKKRKRRKSP